MLAGMTELALGDNKAAFFTDHFAPLRDKSIKILALNIKHSRLLEDLQNFFLAADLVGVGADPAVKQLGGDRVAIEQINPASIEDLVELGMKYGRFDLIVDGGSPKAEDQITALRTLFPFLRNGGHYAAYELRRERSSQTAGASGGPGQCFVEYLKQLVDLRMNSTPAELPQLADPFLRTYGCSMNLTFFEKACLIQKSHKPCDISLAHQSQKPLAPIEGENLPVFISAQHDGMGNVVSETGSIRLEGESSALKGFLLQVRDDLQPYISYRALLSNGNWTEWTPCGGFVGGTEPGDALCGFAVRLDDSMKAQATLAMVGAFRGETYLQIARSGEDCVVKSGLHKLFGMQIILRMKRADMN